MSVKRRAWLILIAIAIFAARTFAAGVLYDASSNQLPQLPNFFRFDFDTPIVGPIYGFNAPQSVGGGVYEMGPTDQSRYTFWLTNTTVLDHTQTVRVSARLRLMSQASVNPTGRAGLALSFTDDRNLYNELYVNENEIFINKRVGDQRVRDVSFAMDTVAAFHDYTMQLVGDALTVLVDGIPRLHGSMFDANGLSLPTIENWAVVGDITSSAAGRWQMQTFGVDVSPRKVNDEPYAIRAIDSNASNAVPEPASALMISVFALACARRPRHRKRLTTTHPG